ncbi:MAG: nucleotide exchange factor GrpE [Pedosphaera sp.]|nr:nucleotide exchange factor GrpE [Pedosphaera sp.]
MNFSPDQPHPSGDTNPKPAPPPEFQTLFLPFDVAALSTATAPASPEKEPGLEPERAPGAIVDAPVEFLGGAPEAADDAGEIHEEEAVLDQAELADWKSSLRRDFEAWLDSLEEIHELDAGLAAANAPEGPDLYSFYEQLAASNTETRKNNRRTAEAFSQWGETLTKFDADLRLLREQLARQPVATEDALPRSWCLALVEIVDRLQRLAVAFAASPPKMWWGGDGPWRKAWATQRQGFIILLGHVETLLKQADLTRIATLHEPFDPATMAAVASVPNSQHPPQTVLEEVAPGYRLNGDLLRVAQVKVAASPV